MVRVFSDAALTEIKTLLWVELLRPRLRPKKSWKEIAPKNIVFVHAREVTQLTKRWKKKYTLYHVFKIDASYWLLEGCVIITTRVVRTRPWKSDLESFLKYYNTKRDYDFWIKFRPLSLDTLGDWILTEHVWSVNLLRPAESHWAGLNRGLLVEGSVSERQRLFCRCHSLKVWWQHFQSGAEIAKLTRGT